LWPIDEVSQGEHRGAGKHPKAAGHYFRAIISAVDPKQTLFRGVNFQMTKANSVNWRRLSAEAAAIVISILLAFAIDALWEEKQERKAEQEYLSAILVDIDVVLHEAERTIAGNEALNESARNRIAALHNGESLSASAVSALLDENWSNYRLRANLDSYDDLLTSGAVMLIRSSNVRSALAKLRTEMDFERQLHLTALDAGGMVRSLLLESLDDENFALVARVEEDAIGTRSVHNARKLDVREAALEARAALLDEIHQ
tara:strand:+ start:909 stop:1682 length:774 start_codon:yes stop_codon:yes gene_type:complete